MCFHKYCFYVTWKAHIFEWNPTSGPTQKTLHPVETSRWNWLCFVTATDSESPCQPVMSFLSQTSESHDRSNDTAFSFSTTQKLIGPPCGPPRSEVICFKLSLRERAGWFSYRKRSPMRSYLRQLPRLQPVTLNLDGSHGVNLTLTFSTARLYFIPRKTKQNVLFRVLVIFSRTSLSRIYGFLRPAARSSFQKPLSASVLVSHSALLSLLSPMQWTTPLHTHTNMS